MYVPNIATEIHQQNLALRAGKGEYGARLINLEAMMVSNPISVRYTFPPFPFNPAIQI